MTSARTAFDQHCDAAQYRAGTASQALQGVQEDAVYLLYTLPTVVISRRTDQYGKAHETLMGGSPVGGKRARVSFAPSASLPPTALPGREPEAPRLLPAASAPPEAGADPT